MALPASVHARELPTWPRAWYVVARSSDFRPGTVRSGTLAERGYVLYRTENGSLVALDGYCPHMGAHLKSGAVCGERLRCALHHWFLAADGSCWGTGGQVRRRSRVWPVAERFGLVFLFLGEGTPPPLPTPEEPDQYGWTTGNPIELDTDWHSMMINGFDLLHFDAVHHRALIEPPQLTRSEGTLELRYLSRVTGGGLADRVMKRVSGNRIRVRQICHGPIIVVETDLGRTRTSAVLGLLTKGGKVRAFGAFGTQRGGLTLRLRLLLARWLFTAFLRKDFAVVEGMRLNLEGVEDVGVRAVSAFLRSLPDVRDV